MNLNHINGLKEQELILDAIDMSSFVTNSEWDIMEVTARVHSKHTNNTIEFRPDIKYYVNIRRKTLFYTVNLIIPCIGMSFLTVIVFGLPSESGEKITLSISILLALTFFFLLLVDILPPTSITVPLLGKYLIFTITMVSLTTGATIYVLNIHHKSPKVHHRMPNLVRKLFSNILAKNTVCQ